MSAKLCSAASFNGVQHSVLVAALADTQAWPEAADNVCNLIGWASHANQGAAATSGKLSNGLVASAISFGETRV